MITYPPPEASPLPFQACISFPPRLPRSQAKGVYITVSPCNYWMFLDPTSSEASARQGISQNRNPRGCPVLVSPFFGETEPALSPAEGAGTLICSSPVRT